MGIIRDSECQGVQLACRWRTVTCRVDWSASSSPLPADRGGCSPTQSASCGIPFDSRRPACCSCVSRMHKHCVLTGRLTSYKRGIGDVCVASLDVRRVTGRKCRGECSPVSLLDGVGFFSDNNDRGQTRGRPRHTLALSNLCGPRAVSVLHARVRFLAQRENREEFGDKVPTSLRHLPSPSPPPPLPPFFWLLCTGCLLGHKVGRRGALYRQGRGALEVVLTRDQMFDTYMSCTLRRCTVPSHTYSII